MKELLGGWKYHGLAVLLFLLSVGEADTMAGWVGILVGAYLIAAVPFVALRSWRGAEVDPGV